MENKFLFRKLLDQYPEMEPVLINWFMCYFDDNHPDHYFHNLLHLLHPKPDIEIRDFDVVVQSNKPLNGIKTYVHCHWALSIIEASILDRTNLIISYKPVQDVQRFSRNIAGKVKWKIYKGTALVKKGIGEYDFYEDLSSKIFLPNAFEIICEELKNEKGVL